MFTFVIIYRSVNMHNHIDLFCPPLHLFMKLKSFSFRQKHTFPRTVVVSAAVDGSGSDRPAGTDDPMPDQSRTTGPDDPLSDGGGQMTAPYTRPRALAHNFPNSSPYRSRPFVNCSHEKPKQPHHLRTTCWAHFFYMGGLLARARENAHLPPAKTICLTTNSSEKS